MADIDLGTPASMPAGIVTFHMIYTVIDKLLKRMDKVEARIIKLEPKPKPVTKEIKEEKKDNKVVK